MTISCIYPVPRKIGLQKVGRLYDNFVNMQLKKFSWTYFYQAEKMKVANSGDEYFRLLGYPGLLQKSKILLSLQF